MDKSRIVDVTADNVGEYGFFCLMSRRKSKGYRRKLDWLLDRFQEGLKLRLIIEGASAFGIFGVVCKGELMSYHYLTEKQLHDKLIIS